MAQSADPEVPDGARSLWSGSRRRAAGEPRALSAERVRELLDLVGATPEDVGRALELGDGALDDCLLRGAPPPVAYALLGLAVASRRITPAQARRLLLRQHGGKVR